MAEIHMDIEPELEAGDALLIICTQDKWVFSTTFAEALLNSQHFTTAVGEKLAEAQTAYHHRPVDEFGGEIHA